MFNISKNGIITVSRGDTFTLEVFINLGTAVDPIQYRLEEGDYVYFALMEPHQPFEHALIRKMYDYRNLNKEGSVVMKFITEDTEYLMPGNYYYMVKLYRAGGESGEEESVDTIVSKTKFIIID